MLKNRLEVNNLLIFFIQSSFLLPETNSHEAIFLSRSLLNFARVAMFRCNNNTKKINKIIDTTLFEISNYLIYFKKPDLRIGSSISDTEEIKKHPFFQEVDWDLVQKKVIDPPFQPSLAGKKDLAYFDKVVHM